VRQGQVAIGQRRDEWLGAYQYDFCLDSSGGLRQLGQFRSNGGSALKETVSAGSNGGLKTHFARGSQILAFPYRAEKNSQEIVKNLIKVVKDKERRGAAASP
jgi:hypothetical protein